MFYRKYMTFTSSIIFSIVIGSKILGGIKGM